MAEFTRQAELARGAWRIPAGWTEIASCPKSLIPTYWGVSGGVIDCAYHLPFPGGYKTMDEPISNPGPGERRVTIYSEWVQMGTFQRVWELIVISHPGITGDPASPTGEQPWYGTNYTSVGAFPEVGPMVDPMLNPIGLPRQVPVYRPQHRPVTRPHPGQMPGQSREGGYAAPRQPVPNLVPEHAFGPRGATVTMAPPPIRKPPSRNEKEKKTAAQKAMAQLLNAVLALTEVDDFLDALGGALPAGLYDDGDLYGQLSSLIENADSLDAAKALNNLVENFVEDFVVGRLSGAAQKKMRDLGITATTIQT